jgi:hypothetical protein
VGKEKKKKKKPTINDKPSLLHLHVLEKDEQSDAV